MSSLPSAPDSRPAPRLSVVVPTYNERERLTEFVETVSAVLSRHGITAEIIIVDDNSPDGTGALADELARHHPHQVGLEPQPGREREPRARREESLRC